MRFEIDLPTQPFEIVHTDTNEGYIRFEKNDMSIDVEIDSDEEIHITGIWITGQTKYELYEVPFLFDWADHVIRNHREQIINNIMLQ